MSAGIVHDNPSWYTVFMNKFWFLFFNVVISSNLLFWILGSICIELSAGIFYTIERCFVSDADISGFGIFLISCLFTCLLFLGFKVLIFILLSHCKCKDSYMGQFFERMKNDGKYMLKVFWFALLSDIFCILIIPAYIDSIVSFFFDEKGITSFSFSASIVLGGGVTLSYVSLMIWIKIIQPFYNWVKRHLFN